MRCSSAARWRSPSWRRAAWPWARRSTRMPTARRSPGARWRMPASAAASSCCPATSSSPSASRPTPRPRSSPPMPSPTVGWVSTSAPRRRRVCPPAGGRPHDLLERAHGRVRAGGLRGGHPRRRARGGGVGRRLGGRRRRLGRGRQPGRGRRSHQPRVDGRRRRARAGRGAHASRAWKRSRRQRHEQAPVRRRQLEDAQDRGRGRRLRRSPGGARAGERRRGGVPDLHGARRGGGRGVRRFGSPSTPRTCTRRRAVPSRARSRPR